MLHVSNFGACCYPVCHYGWKGDLCDECETFPGCDHGTCTEPWKCVCDTNWGGLLCDKVEHACLSSPCVNGATCGSLCVCLPGFTGKHCQTAVGACESAPCLHGGQCVEQKGVRSMVCNCPMGYTGTYCEFNFSHLIPSGCNYFYLMMNVFKMGPTISYTATASTYCRKTELGISGFKKTALIG
uniref:EGF-like domain-containing protein n=1 Tax=Astyanax mexicanus TaxID=7994 RepID=A0A3B1JUB5_ASTMX